MRAFAQVCSAQDLRRTQVVKIENSIFEFFRFSDFQFDGPSAELPWEKGGETPAVARSFAI